MPPRRQKVDHRRGGGGKHISSIEEVKARNAGEETAYDKARKAKKGEEEEEDEESEPEEKPTEKKTGVGGLQTDNPNAVRRNEEKEGVELTRRQREEIEKNNARRRYEELHKAGKTDEAKADLARLEEVKKRREEAAKKRQDEEAKAKEKEADKVAEGKKVLVSELKSVMGGEGNRKRQGGGGSKKKEEKEKEKEKEKDEEEKDGKDNDDPAAKKKIMNGVDEGEVYAAFGASSKDSAGGGRFQATDGSIESCREAEADFM